MFIMFIYHKPSTHLRLHIHLLFLGTPEQLHFARELLNQASVKRDLPALAAPDAVLMPQTVLENTFTTQPQQRNIHGRIFGGFLMRRAFELAHSCAYMLSACRPRTVAVDEIRFKKPVDVGDLVRFRARVLWTWHEPEQPDKVRCF
jgi:acyl-coenzyme A thioesterase 9